MMAGDENAFDGGVNASQVSSDSMSEGDFESGGLADQQPLAPQSTPQQSTTSGQGQSQSQTEAQAHQTLIDLAASMGYDFGQNRPGDDYTAFSQIVSRAQQAQLLEQQRREERMYTDLGRQLAPKAQDIQGYLQQQAKPAGPKPYEPPPFDDRWATMVTQDPATGMYVGKPGTHPNIVDAVNKFAEYQRNFTRNPVEIMRQVARDEASGIQEQINQAVAAGIQQYQQQQQVRQIVEANSPWAMQRDAQGNLVRDFNGQAIPTPLGQQYVATLQMLGRNGMTDPVARDQVARAMLASQIAAASGTTANQQAANTRQAQALRQQQQRRSPMQALTQTEQRETSNTLNTTPPSGYSMRDALAAAFQEEGITDAYWKSSSLGN